MKRRAFVGGCWLGLRLLFLSLPFERCRIADEEEEEETTVMLCCVVCSEVGVDDDDACGGDCFDGGNVDQKISHHSVFLIFRNCHNFANSKCICCFPPSPAPTFFAVLHSLSHSPLAEQKR